MYGDLHVCTEGFYFLAFKKLGSLSEILYAFYGLLGIFFAYRAHKRRKDEMARWREGHAEKFLDELVEEFEGSWAILAQQIKIIKPRFATSDLVIEHKDGKKFSFEIKKEQVKQINQFARQNNWPAK